MAIASAMIVTMTAMKTPRRKGSRKSPLATRCQ
jgi:hypothetical protein